MSTYIAIAAMTLDGKIAKDPNHLSTTWTSAEDKVFFQDMLKQCDAVIVGRNTYETAKEPLSKRNTVVISRQVSQLVSPSATVTFINPGKTDLKKFIADKGWQSVAVLGGAQIYTYCLQNDLFDELYLTIEPIVFGQGIGLSAANIALDKKFRLLSSKILNTQGTILLHYKKI